MAEFFGFGGYSRTPEGYMSWQHLVFVTSLLLIMTGLAIFLGIKNKYRNEKIKNKVLIITAIVLDCIEIVRLTIICFREGGVDPLKRSLPLFLCSIQFITIPLAAFSKGRVKEAALDFVFIFGILGAVLGTYGAGQNYNAYPVLSLDNVSSGLTHTIPGFASLYIAISKMISMKVKNIWITFTILISFCVMAFIANKLLNYNYMFLRRGDGTPYDIFYNLVNGNAILYPIIVVVLFLLYISVFYLVYFIIKKASNKQIELN